jgi:hypothetical protein
MQRPDHKTKIVATIGPASDSQETLEGLIGVGFRRGRARRHDYNGSTASTAQTRKVAWEAPANAARGGNRKPEENGQDTSGARNAVPRQPGQRLSRPAR